MKTIFIYDQLLENPMQFFILEGDYTHLDNTYINSGNDENKEKELNNILYDPETGDYKLKEMFDHFPLDKINTKEDKVIVVGFIP